MHETIVRKRCKYHLIVWSFGNIIIIYTISVTATHQWIFFFMTDSLDVTPKITEQNLIVSSGKSETEVNNNKRLRSRYC